MRLLVCLDTSEFARSIVPVAKKFAQAVGGAVEIVTVIQPVRASGEPWSGKQPLSPNQVAREKARLSLEPVAAEFDPPATITVFSAADASDAIIRHARLTRPDAILLATHSRGAIAEAAIGSTARQVTRSGVAPVLLLHPTEDVSMNPRDIPIGVHAFTSDRAPLGEVIEVTADQLHIRRDDGSDLWLPATAARTISGGYLALDVAEAELDRMQAGATG